jgi:hypothetical protein
MLTMSRGLLEDYKRQARAEEQERIINLLVTYSISLGLLVAEKNLKPLSKKKSK